MLTHYLMTMQHRLHLSDSAFAESLGLDAETWQSLRVGRAGYTPTILARLLLHVPNAHALALEELRLQQQMSVLHLLEDTVAPSAQSAVAVVPAASAVEQPAQASAGAADQAATLAYAA